MERNATDGDEVAEGFATLCLLLYFTSAPPVANINHSKALVRRAYRRYTHTQKNPSVVIF
jgi:hypothetical protein